MSQSLSLSIEKKLKQGYLDLSEAHRNRDWAWLADLEPEVRNIIQDMTKDKAVLTENAQRLLDDLEWLYQEMIDTCEQEISQIKKQVLAGQKRQEALSSYLSRQSNTDSQ
ncbi:hypothetical protein [Endozoicomonas lisbonensis]|uniref:Vacuolar-type H+-ATPase subunit H n=1 Tax=Endozoicomonas lisbonensis TaxID=3120522 RepID=A0ABV2SGQ3_9GAMM